MPEIKYTGTPKQTPEEARRTAQIPEYRLSMPDIRFTRAGQVAGEALGEATRQLGATVHTLGASIDSLGRTMSGAGDELFNRALGLKQLETETAVNNATIAWEQGQIKKDEEFKKLNGEAASSSALEAHLKSSEDDRQKFRNSVGSQQAQKMFDQQTTRPYLQFARSAAAHANQETKKFATQTVEARADMLGNRMSSSKEDKDFYEGAKEGYRLFMDERRHLLGQDEVTAQRDYMTWFTKGIAAWAQKISTDGDNARAMKILEDNKDDLDKVDRNIFTKVYSEIKKKNDNDMAYTAADKAANAGKLDDPYEVKERRLIEELDRIKRPDLLREAITDLRSREAIDQYKHHQAVTKALDNVNKALHNPAPGQQEPPKTEKEAMAIIDKKDWALLDERQKQAAKDIWLANAMGNYPETPDTIAEFHYWQGSMLFNPKEVRAKMAEDPAFIDKLKIPKEDRKQLYSLYLRVETQGAKSEEDQRVGRVYSYGKNNFLITPAIDGNEKKKYRMYSYLSSELDQWHKDHPKQMPKPDDFKDMVNRARSQVEDKSSWWGTLRDRYELATEPPRDYKDTYKQTHHGASEEEIGKAYLNDIISGKIKLEEKGSKKPTPSRITSPTPVVTPQVGFK